MTSAELNAAIADLKQHHEVLAINMSTFLRSPTPDVKARLDKAIKQHQAAVEGLLRR